MEVRKGVPLMIKAAARCPDCGGPIVHGEGCICCPLCGYTRC